MSTTPPGTPPRRHDNILAVGLARANGTSGDANGVGAPAATQPVHGLVRRTSFFRRRNLSTEILGGPGPPTVVTPASKAAEAVPQDGTTSPRAAARDEQAICDAIAKAVKEIADVQQGSALKRLARTLAAAATTPRPSQPAADIVITLQRRDAGADATHFSTSSGSASSATDSILTSISIEPSPVTPLPAVRSAGANDIPRSRSNLGELSKTLSVDDRQTAAEVCRLAVQRFGLPGIAIDYIAVLADPRSGVERILADNDVLFSGRFLHATTVTVHLRQSPQVRRSMSMRSLAAAEAESAGKPTAGSSSSTASSAAARSGSASDKEDASPDQLPRLSTSIANDGAMWEMYGPVVNSLLLDALNALSQLAERREAPTENALDTALMRDLNTASSQLTAAYRSLLSTAETQRPLVYPAPGFVIDACPSDALLSDAVASAKGSGALPPPPVAVESAEPRLHYLMNTTLYKDHFWDGKAPVDDQEHLLINDPTWGPLCVTVGSAPSADPGRRLYRILVWSRDGNVLHVFPARADQKLSREGMDHFLRQLLVPRGALAWSARPEIGRALYKIEAEAHEAGYKVGVLYVREGQTSEDDMFGNAMASPAFEEFLQLLGTRIQQKDWAGYRGGLDVQHGTTGQEAVFTSWRGLDIMFHVSTLLPYDRVNPQQIARKRHLGNDVCVIVFVDGLSSYMPTAISSRLNHVFAVVRPNADKTYSLAVGVRESVGPFGPPIQQARYRRDEGFRDLLLAKIVNGQNAALDAPAFREKLKRAREFLLSDIVRLYGMREAAPVNDPASGRQRMGTFSRTKSAFLALARGGGSHSADAATGGSSSNSGSGSGPRSSGIPLGSGPMTQSKSTETMRTVFADDPHGRPPLAAVSASSLDHAMAAGNPQRPSSASDAPLGDTDDGSSSASAASALVRPSGPHRHSEEGSSRPHQPSRSMSFRGLRSLHRRSVTDMADEGATSTSTSSSAGPGARMPAVAEEP